MFSLPIWLCASAPTCGIEVLLIPYCPGLFRARSPSHLAELASLDATASGPCKLRESAYTPTTQLNTSRGRAKASRVDPKVLSAYVGNCHSENSSTTINMTVEDGVLQGQFNSTKDTGPKSR